MTYCDRLHNAYTEDAHQDQGIVMAPGVTDRILYMSGKSITLDLPDDLYAHVLQVAEQQQCPVERVVVESLRALFVPPPPGVDVAKRLAELSSYSDAQLWAVVYQRLPWLQSQQLHELSMKTKLGRLPDHEQRELDALLALNDHAMLRRSEALRLLHQRRHDITAYLERGA